MTTQEKGLKSGDRFYFRTKIDPIDPFPAIKIRLTADNVMYSVNVYINTLLEV